MMDSLRQDSASAALLSLRGRQINNICWEEAKLSGWADAFECWGEVLTGDAMAARLSRHWTQPVSVLARWIVERRVLNFRHGGVLMLPTFQFDVASGQVHPAVSQVIDQLRNVFDDDDLSQWFVLPHAVLGGEAPLRKISCASNLAIEAARVTHFARC